MSIQLDMSTTGQRATSELEQFHILSFEGPDPYARAGGIATRVTGLARALAERGHSTHLWFVGDPDLPGHEREGSCRCTAGASGSAATIPPACTRAKKTKCADYAASLPPFLMQYKLVPELLRAAAARSCSPKNGRPSTRCCTSIALLRRAHLRDRVSIFWNANNTFGFERIDWPRLAAAATIVTVSRYMKHCMRAYGVEAVVIPNGLAPESFTEPSSDAVDAAAPQRRGPHADRQGGALGSGQALAARGRHRRRAQAQPAAARCSSRAAASKRTSSRCSSARAARPTHRRAAPVRSRRARADARARRHERRRRDRACARTSTRTRAARCFAPRTPCSPTAATSRSAWSAWKRWRWAAWPAPARRVRTTRRTDTTRSCCSTTIPASSSALFDRVRAHAGGDAELRRFAALTARQYAWPQRDRAQPAAADLSNRLRPHPRRACCLVRVSS